MYSLALNDIVLQINCPKTVNLTDLVNLKSDLSQISLEKLVCLQIFAPKLKQVKPL